MTVSVLSYNTYFASDKGKKYSIALTVKIRLTNLMHNVIKVFGEINCFDWRRKMDDII